MQTKKKLKAEASHTSGPWSIADTGAEELTIISESDNSDVAFLPGWGDENRQECEANARLITAAPDLLKALQACVRILGRYSAKDPNGETCGDMVPAEARTALAKAEGH